jgi:hypothetical protein
MNHLVHVGKQRRQLALDSSWGKLGKGGIKGPGGLAFYLDGLVGLVSDDLISSMVGSTEDTSIVI